MRALAELLIALLFISHKIGYLYSSNVATARRLMHSNNAELSMLSVVRRDTSFDDELVTNKLPRWHTQGALHIAAPLE